MFTSLLKVKILCARKLKTDDIPTAKKFDNATECLIGKVKRKIVKSRTTVETPTRAQIINRLSINFFIMLNNFKKGF